MADDPIPHILREIRANASKTVAEAENALTAYTEGRLGSAYTEVALGIRSSLSHAMTAYDGLMQEFDKRGIGPADE